MCHTAKCQTIGMGPKTGSSTMMISTPVVKAGGAGPQPWRRPARMTSLPFGCIRDRGLLLAGSSWVNFASITAGRCTPPLSDPGDRRW